MAIKIDQSWKEKLADEFAEPYFVKLSAFIKEEYEKNTVYPDPENIFRAFDLCPFDKVKVVIIGQDPYHGAKQANGLCFAVDKETKLPPSLQNIFKEIEKDIGTPAKEQGGDLERWAKQCVLLLNATLTVRASLAGSHQNKGWEEFTDAAIQALSRDRQHIVFMLWGNYAKAKGAHIDRKKHLVLEAAHPSPFSAYSGFFGCKHFSKANTYLVEHKKTPIEW